MFKICWKYNCIQFIHKIKNPIDQINKTLMCSVVSTLLFGCYLKSFKMEKYLGAV